MFTFTWFFSSIYYCASFLLCSVLVGFGMPKRKYFWVRFALCALALTAATFVSRAITYSFNIPPFTAVGVSRYVVYYVIVTLTIWRCFDCNLWAALFCSTVGYCMEHLAERLFELINRPLLQGINVWAQYAVRTVIFAAAVAALYFFLIRKSKYYRCNLMVDNKLQIITSVIAVGILIFVNSFAIRLAMGNVELIIYINIMSLSFSFACVVLELGIASNKSSEEELNMVKHVLHEEHKRWKLEKENMELLNIKCHDLKHQLINGSRMDKEAAEIMREELELFDAHIDTGNEALNVVLYKKMLECNRKNIQLTCMLDGRHLNGISAHEIYSLFGNALDNAINAIGGLESEKRIISITESYRGGFNVINIENYFDGTVEFLNGIPKTQKDSNYHGFGIKSMKFIAEKYGGTIAVCTANDLFILEILLPCDENC